MDDDEALRRVRLLAQTETDPPEVARWRVAGVGAEKSLPGLRHKALRSRLGVAGIAAAATAIIAVGLVASRSAPHPRAPVAGVSPSAVLTPPPGAIAPSTPPPAPSTASGIAAPKSSTTQPPAPTSPSAISISTWGYRGDGEAGDGAPHGSGSSSTPRQLSGWTSIATASGGGNNGYAVKTDGSVWAWGPDWAGQLGNGGWAEADTPVRVLGPGGVGYLSGITQISTGDNHAVALRSDGTVWAWGRNDYGQLGDATTVSRNTPHQVCAPGQPHANPVPTANLGVTAPASPCTSFLSGVVEIAVGGGQNFALKADGSVYAWGPAWGNLLGNGDQSVNSCPTNPWESGGPYQCAPVPVAVCGGTNGLMSPCNSYLTGVAKISAGENDAFAIMKDGTVRSWGDDAYGELGNGTSCSSFPCTSYSSPVSVPALTGVSQIAVGAWHALALTPAGNVLSWGDNGSGQLGVNSACNGGVESCIGRTTPTAVGILTGVTQVATGGDFSAAVRSDGTLWTWGNNGSGELGKPVCGSDPCYAAGNGQPSQVSGIRGVIAVYLEQRTVIALSK